VSVAATVAPLGGHPFLVFMLQVGLLLTLAILFGRLAVRLGMPAIVGELSAGVMLGPSLLGAVWAAGSDWLLPQTGQQFHLLDAVGQVGALLLVGVTGMQVDLKLVRRRGSTAARISIAGLVIPLALGVATGFLVPAALIADGTDVTVFALFLGVAMCVSAIPVIAKTLMDMKLLHRNVSQLCLTAGMVDDAVGWFLLSVVSAMATTGLSTAGVLLPLVKLLFVALAALLVGRPLVRVVMRRVTRSDEPVSAVAAVTAMVVLAAAGTHALGLEAILGAFVAGLLIAQSGRLDATWMNPLRTTVLVVLAPIFFATAGLRMDLTALADPTTLVVALVILAVAILGKFAGAFVGALTSRLNRWEALAIGAGMNARGVVEVIVAMVGLRLGVLTTDTYTVIVLVAIVTSLMAPPVLRVAMARLESTAEEQLREAELAGRAA
jgi:Kef-type K+ transport system membrane component KefB